jgi:hypothetical protein
MDDSEHLRVSCGYDVERSRVRARPNVYRHTDTSNRRTRHERYLECYL